MAMSCVTSKSQNKDVMYRMTELHVNALSQVVSNVDMNSIKSHSRVRQLLFNDLSDFISQIDTFILFTAFDDQSGQHVGSLWTPESEFNFKTNDESNASKLEITQERSQYSLFVIRNILTNNLENIEERINTQSPLIGGLVVNVFFGTKVDGVFDIKYYRFVEFMDSLNGFR